MEAVGGLVTILNIGLGLAIGAKLLRLARASGGSERWLGLYFLLTFALGQGLACFVYVSWTDPDLALPDAVATPLHGAYLLASNAGFAALAVFTWRTFRRDALPAAGAAAALVSGLGFALVAQALGEGFAVRVIPGAAYWLGFLLRSAALAWLAVESLRWFAALRRRLRLGLAEPLVTNRFLLLGVWACAMFGMGMADVVARIWYVSSTGSADRWVPELAHSLVMVTISITSALGIVVATTLLLAFFPTTWFRRWVEHGAPVALAEAPAAK
jgi:hypothetical protein